MIRLRDDDHADAMSAMFLPRCEYNDMFGVWADNNMFDWVLAVSFEGESGPKT